MPEKNSSSCFMESQILKLFSVLTIEASEEQQAPECEASNVSATEYLDTWVTF